MARVDGGKRDGAIDSCPPSNPFCKDATKPDAGPKNTCGNAPIDLDTVGVNVMLAIDGSASMAPHWQRIKDSVSQLRAAHPESQFGVQVFWGELPENFDQLRDKANWCGGTKQVFVDVGPNPAQQLTDSLGAAPPGPGFLGGVWETSPVIEPLNYYVENVTKLADPTRTNYLILLSDGNDNCFGSMFVNEQDKLLAYEKIAVELGKRNIRVLPIGFDAASAASWNGSNFTTPPTTNFAALGTLLKFGGTGLAEVPRVENPEQFAAVLDQVGTRVRSCRFAIPSTAGSTAINPFELSFTINGAQVQRDRTNSNGWNFVGGDIHQLELFGDACQAVRAGSELTSQKTCATQTCGSAAVEVQTKPRAVLYALDASASRIECADGTFDCLLTVGQPTRTSYTFWETVQHVLGQSLVEPINDDVESGLQLFPSKTQAQLNCDVATMPEIAPRQGSQIEIISTMLEKLPFGLSPVVSAIENIAANPGRLVEPDVLGAVVMLTDGGDNCAGGSQEETVSRLGAAAKSLLDRGVKTYVVRFGSATGKTPEQDAQLRAIAANGGTARSDPADPNQVPYIDAKDETDLNAALAELSDRLSSCEITVANLPADADKDLANLYLNGALVPKQTMGVDNGWNWKDAEQTIIDLHGAECDEFKTSRKTSVIVEFGCVPVYVM
ncbi:MAG TPA: vWA domain-containing protein [Polyangiales bacterium]|nr:vWA domain-containing protein [Polyangiales bacterium]